MAPKSTFYKNATILTLNSSREVILNGSILVVGNKIERVGLTRDLQVSDIITPETEIVDLFGRSSCSHSLYYEP